MPDRKRRSTEIVHATRCPLIVLERHEATVDPALLTRVRSELLAGRGARRAFRSGFLLGVEAGAGRHPACTALVSCLQARLLGGEPERRFSLSFLKLAEGTPPRADEGPFYEGPHLDTHPELTESTELLRLLVNLSSHPRRFLYAATDRWQLTEAGVRYGRREYERLELPRSVETRVVVLPGRTTATISALRFFASVVPHVGLNDPPEHFLLSYEALSPVGSLTTQEVDR